MLPEGRVFEFLLAAVVALVVVGPKDLPALLRKLGQFMARVRAMAAEFRASFDEMARQSELDELRKEVEAMRKAQMSDITAQIAAPEMTQTFDELSQGLSDVGVDLNAPSASPYALAQTEAVDALPAPKPKAPRKRAVKPAAKARGAKATAKKPSAKAAAKPAGGKTAAKPPKAAKPRAAAKAAARSPRRSAGAGA